MKRIREKLKSQSGASFLIGLVFFFLCVMVGSVIMASASANVDKSIERRENEQQYLAMSSAVRLLRETIGKVSGSTSEWRIRYSCYPMGMGFFPSPEENETDCTAQMDLTGGGDGKLQKDLAQMAYEMFRYQTHIFASSSSKPAPMEFTIAGSGMPLVRVKLTMYESYNVTCQVTVDDSDYACTIAFGANVQATDPGNPAIEAAGSCRHDWTELVDDPENGGQMEVPCSQNFARQKETLTTSVTWDGGTVTKGVVEGG